MDHTVPSWKEDEMLVQLNYSVENAVQAVGQAQSNPTEEQIQDARQKIERAEHSFANAIQTRGQIEPIQRLQEEFNESKNRLEKLH